MRLANGRHEVIGVNADRRESDLDVIPEDVLALWRGKQGPASQPAAAAGGRRRRRNLTASGGTSCCCFWLGQ